MIDLGSADFFQSWEGKGSRIAIAEEAYESEATVAESGDGCRIAEEFVEAFVSAFGRGGPEDVDAVRGGDYKNAVGADAGF